MSATKSQYTALAYLEPGTRFALAGIPTRTGTVRAQSPTGTTVLYDGWDVPPEVHPETGAGLQAGRRWSPCLISGGTVVVPLPPASTRQEDIR